MGMTARAFRAAPKTMTLAFLIVALSQQQLAPSARPDRYYSPGNPSCTSA
jgi:hypothetical protein